MTVLDLFSGIGGFSLGLERTGGFRTAAFCEIDPYCRRVLAKHWPEVPCYDDIRTLTADRLAADGIAVDVICGGFPCQDVSVCGDGAGLSGGRSGLWAEQCRLVREIRPDFLIVENVAALLHRGMGEVLGDLAAIGYDAEWSVVSACAMGAPHTRERVWIVAYPTRDGWQERRPFCLEGDQISRRIREGEFSRGGSGEPWSGHWMVEPGVGRVADGVPDRMDRLSALGNAVAPQIPELIGRAILAAVFR